MITYTAFITTEQNAIGADPGLSVEMTDFVDGVAYPQYTGGTRVDNPEFALGDEDGDLDEDAAQRILAQAGYQMADSGWRRSGDGQWAAKVEPASA